jgi:hypothetical protein
VKVNHKVWSGFDRTGQVDWSCRIGPRFVRFGRPRLFEAGNPKHQDAKRIEKK